jgi:hypothetical protein
MCSTNKLQGACRLFHVLAVACLVALLVRALVVPWCTCTLAVPILRAMLKTVSYRNIFASLWGALIETKASLDIEDGHRVLHLSCALSVSIVLFGAR